MAIPEKDFPMFEAMRRDGGSFVKALALALVWADVDNYSRLEKAFPEYFEKYREIANKQNDNTKTN